MRTLAKILVAVGIALAVSTTASATLSISLIQTGGTYAGAAAAGQTLTLTIVLSGDAAGPETAVASVDPWIDYTGLGTYTSGASLGFIAFNAGFMPELGGGCCSVVGGAVVHGWDYGALTPPTAAPAFSVTLGTVTFTLNGTGGVISVLGSAGGTIIGNEAFVNVADSSGLGTFTIVPIPEPTTASLLGLGLLGLTVAGRRRN